LLSEILDCDNFKKEIFLAVAPYFHIMGLSTMLHLPLLVGSKIVLTFPFSKEEDFGHKLLRAISYTRVSIFVGAPRFYDMMLISFQKKLWKWSLFNFSCLKICISGAVELPKSLRRKFKKVFGTSILEGYGMSESGITHCQKNGFNSAGSVGSVFTGVEHKILDPDDAGRGEVLVRSPGFMSFYFGGGLEEEIFIDCDGWLHTADLGYINEKGELFLTGRKRYIIKTRHGENIYPIDIERVLHSHKLVKEAAVVGRKGQDDDYEEIAAFVVLKEDLDEEYSYNELGSGLLESGLKEYCKLKLSSFKIPHKIYFIVELPKNIFGKVLKNELPKY
jgi:long-chain acyl-CoA synthetase